MGGRGGSGALGGGEARGIRRAGTFRVLDRNVSGQRRGDEGWKTHLSAVPMLPLLILLLFFETSLFTGGTSGIDSSS